MQAGGGGHPTESVYAVNSMPSNVKSSQKQCQAMSKVVGAMGVAAPGHSWRYRYALHNKQQCA